MPQLQPQRWRSWSPAWGGLALAGGGNGLGTLTHTLRGAPGRGMTHLFCLERTSEANEYVFCSSTCFNRLCFILLAPNLNTCTAFTVSD